MSTSDHQIAPPAVVLVAAVYWSWPALRLPFPRPQRLSAKSAPGSGGRRILPARRIAGVSAALETQSVPVARRKSSVAAKSARPAGEGQARDGGGGQRPRLRSRPQRDVYCGPATVGDHQRASLQGEGSDWTCGQRGRELHPHRHSSPQSVVVVPGRHRCNSTT